VDAWGVATADQQRNLTRRGRRSTSAITELSVPQALLVYMGFSRAITAGRSPPHRRP
jgi:hypothetical protein